MSKTVFITGAGKGIGRAIAIKFASLGNRVCINDLDIELSQETKAECEKFGAGAIIALGDVSKREEIKEAIEKCNKELGGPDVLVNNAAILGRYSPLDMVEDKEIDTILNVNIKGIFNTVRAAVPYMRKNEWGRIINACSTVAFQPNIGRGLYSITKAAVKTMTKVMAAELAQYGITVNAYAPWKISTDMGNVTDEVLKLSPMRKSGTTEDVAKLVAFLADEESSFITGSTYLIDGGAMSVQIPWRSREK